jgi:ADP-ribosylglycohydrolase
MRDTQFTGCIVGLAVGDALGYPAEFRSRRRLLEALGPQGITDFLALRDPRLGGPVFLACLEKVPKLVDQPPEEVLVKEGLGEGWVAEEAVASALYCFWRHPDDYREAVLEATNTDGDSDSLACIAGSFCGARLGLEGIPAAWVQRVEDSEHLKQVGTRLAAARGL